MAKIGIEFCLKNSEITSNNYPIELGDGSDYSLITEFSNLSSNPFKLGDEIVLSFGDKEDSPERDFLNGKIVRIIEEQKEITDLSRYKNPFLMIHYTCEICGSLPEKA